MKHLPLYFIFAFFITACDNPDITKKLKEYNIISTVEDREFLPNQIRKTHDWGFIIQEDKEYKIADINGKILTKNGFKKIPTFHNNVAVIQSLDGKYGLINTKGQLLAETIYYKIENFMPNGFAIIRSATMSSENRGVIREGLIKTSGAVALKPKYFNIKYIEAVGAYKVTHHHYREKKRAKTSFYSPKEGWNENISFESIGKFENGIAIITNQSKSGLIDHDLNIIIPPIYKHVSKLSDGLIQITNDQKQSAFFDSSGKIIIPFKDYRATSFKNGISFITSNDSSFTKRKIALMDKSGSIITDFKFTKVEDFMYNEFHQEYFAKASPTNNPYYGLINLKGDYIINANYRNITPDEKGYFSVSLFEASINTPISKKTFHYLTDTKNNIFVDPQVTTPNYNKPKSIGKIGILDSDRNIISLPIYDDIRIDFDGVMAVSMKNHWGIIDKQNNKILPIMYQDIKFISPSKAILKKNNKWGIINLSNNNIVLPFEYTDIEVISSQQVQAKKNKTWKTITL